MSGKLQTIVHTMLSFSHGLLAMRSPCHSYAEIQEEEETTIKYLRGLFKKLRLKSLKKSRPNIANPKAKHVKTKLMLKTSSLNSCLMHPIYFDMKVCNLIQVISL